MELRYSQTALSASILQIEMQNTLRAQEKDNRSTLDIVSYLQGKEQVIKLKTIMLDQAHSQVNIYQEILLENPDLLKIVNNSQKVNRLSFLIEKQMNKYFIKTIMMIKVQLKLSLISSFMNIHKN